MKMRKYAWIYALILVLFLASGGCNDKTKQIVKERDDLRARVQELNDDNAKLKKSYSKAKAEQVRLQGRVGELSQKMAAGECEIQGEPTWEFKDREFLASCSGTVKNTGSVSVSNVTIMIIFRDANLEVLKLRYTSGQPTRQGIFYVMIRERMNEGETRDFTLSVYTKYLQGDDFRAIKDAINAKGDRLEIKPMFIQ
jgi:outer membrane murein-binding lipoprotein Lpp